MFSSETRKNAFQGIWKAFFVTWQTSVRSLLADLYYKVRYFRCRVQIVSRHEVSILAVFQNITKHFGSNGWSIYPHHVVILPVSASRQFDTAEP